MAVHNFDSRDERPRATGGEPYWDASLPISERVADLVSRMSLREKIGQMMQLDARADLDSHIQKKNVGSILHTSPDDLYRAYDLVQQTRLRIPVLVGDDLIHGYSFYPGATIFPEQLGMAVSWDAEKIAKAAQVTAREAAPTGVQWTFSPVLCIARDTRWGRVGETFGEDAHLIGELASAMVRGYQGGAGVGDSLSDDSILACAKHFAGYSETQGGRDASEADLSHRKLASWFLPPFERVAREGVGTFMLGYESIEGVPVTINSWLLSDVLRGQWGYEGMLITDWANVSRLVWEQRIMSHPVEAAVAAVRAGNDMIMTSPEFYEAAYQAVMSEKLDESELNPAVERILALKFRLGLFENPRLPDAALAQTVIGSAEHAQVNLELARESVALLRNNGVLPLVGGGIHGDDDTSSTGGEYRKIALIGPLIDDAQTQLGDWAGSSGQVPWMSDGHPRETITTIIDGMRDVISELNSQMSDNDARWEVNCARGADIVDLVPDPEGEFYPDGQPRPYIGQSAPVDEAQLAQAVELARNSDVAVVVVGDVIQLVGEGCSTATLDLLGGQNALLDAVIATGTPTVVILMSSKPQILPDSALNADAILWAPSPGMKGGQAIAEIVFGLVEPAGRLPITFPRHVGQLPVYYNQIRGQHGNRYADLTQEPAFAFGEGLAYTTFEYSDITISGYRELVESVQDIDTDTWEMESGESESAAESAAESVGNDEGVSEGDSGVAYIGRFGRDDTVHASITVTNTGNRPGVEIVQAYIGDIVTSVSWTDRELKAFKRVEIPAGQSVTVEFDIPVSACSIVNANAQRIVEDGEFELLIGHSSKRSDLKRAVFAVRD